MTRSRTLTLESARAELREARHTVGAELSDGGKMSLVTAMGYKRTLRRYRFARCVDLEYALRLDQAGVNVSQLGRAS